MSLFPSAVLLRHCLLFQFSHFFPALGKPHLARFKAKLCSLLTYKHLSEGLQSCWNSWFMVCLECTEILGCRCAKTREGTKSAFWGCTVAVTRREMSHPTCWMETSLTVGEMSWKESPRREDSFSTCGFVKACKEKTGWDGRWNRRGKLPRGFLDLLPWRETYRFWFSRKQNCLSRIKIPKNIF